MLIKHALMKRRGADIKPAQKAVGFSCVLFAYMTYSAVAMNEYCPFGSASRCFKTWKVPILGGGECLGRRLLRWEFRRCGS